ncbi:MAG: gfo/Idh/MocA family oxidoreductase, partial [Bryobacteraceae bacterium]
MKTDRRRFVQSASAVSLLPRRLLGSQAQQPAPSEKIHVALIGCGTEAIRELPQFIQHPMLRLTAVCDPCRAAIGYRDWSPTGLLQGIRKLLGQPQWGAGFESVIPAGLEVARGVIEAYYGQPGSA